MQRSLPRNQNWFIKPINKWFKNQGNKILTEEDVCKGVAGIGALYAFLDEIQPHAIDRFNDYFYLIDEYKTDLNGLINKINHSRDKLAKLRLREIAIATAWKRLEMNFNYSKDRTQLSKKENDKFDEFIQEEWNTLVKSTISNGDLTNEDMLFIELPVLFEGITFCHQAKEFDDFFDDENKLNPNQPYQHIMPRSLEKKGGIVEIGSFSEAYTLDDIKEYIKSLKLAIENAKPAFVHNFSLMLSSLDLTININYDCQTKSWIFINANILPATRMSDNQVAKAILSSFSSNQYAVFSTRVLTRSDHQEAFSLIYSDWRQQSAHKLTNEEITRCDSNHVNCLHIAAVNGQFDKVVELINARSDVNQADHNGLTPLYIAAEKGHLDIVEVLLAAGADVNKTTNNETSPLHQAAKCGQFKVVEELIAAGAYINKKNKSLRTPEMLAFENGHNDIMSVLKTASELETNHMIDQINLAVGGQQTQQKDNYLEWVNNHSSFFKLTHGKKGEKRAKKLLKKINRENVRQDEVIAALLEAYNASPTHKHSLSRYIMRYLKNTDESIHDLPSSEFAELKKRTYIV